MIPLMLACSCWFAYDFDNWLDERISECHCEIMHDFNSVDTYASFKKLEAYETCQKYIYEYRDNHVVK